MILPGGKYGKTLLRHTFSTLPRRQDPRCVLLVCTGSHVAGHLEQFRRLFEDDDRLRFGLVLTHHLREDGTADRARRTITVGDCGLADLLRRWDLAVLADHGAAAIVDSRHCPVLRLQHGVPGKRLSGETYAFGKGAYDKLGRIRYTRMLVPSEATRDLAVSIDPAYAGVVRVVGSLEDDRLLTESTRREEHRLRLGLRPDDRVVFVTSTYGPESLFHRVGDALLSVARQLRPEFRFILSAHPLDYQPGESGGRVWGDYLRGQAEHGFLIRDPSESFVPYLVACDIVLADHTSVATHAAILRRPVVYVPTREDLIEPGSPIWELRRISPVIREDASDLGDVLARALGEYPFSDMGRVAASLNSCPGAAARRIREETYALLGL